MYTHNELYFPHSAIPALKNIRGAEWAALVERVLSLPENHEETLAFMLMVMRLNGCIPCETDSYRAMKGCIPCAVQTLRRHKGSDDDLLQQYQKALRDLQTMIAQRNTVQQNGALVELR